MTDVRYYPNIVGLADWLLYMQGVYKSLEHIPEIAEHISDLKRWEAAVRILDGAQAPSEALPADNAVRRDAWQSIETAPKDGRDILYINKFGEVGHCRWGVFPEDEIDGIWWDHKRDDEACPLGWMNALSPLPVPRDAEAQRGGE